jgi:hypothetical protein
MGDDNDIEIYTDAYVLEELARLSMHTCDEIQSRIQAVYMWLREQIADVPER